MFTHPLAAEMERWWLAHGSQSDDPAWAGFLTKFNDRLLVKQEELTSVHDNDGRFGMSKAGGCTEAARLKLSGEHGEDFSGSTRMTFWLGHMCELLALTTLESMGYPVSGEQSPARIDPMMHSYTDGSLTYNGVANVLSVKSTGYKKSGKERNKWVRRGFPELPFEGVQKCQPGWYAQLQAEMYAKELEDGIVIVVAKDIIKSMEGDPYMQQNGSLTFYAEHIPYDHNFVSAQLLPVWEDTWNNRKAQSGTPWFFNGAEGRYMRLEPASDSWQPNATRTGTYNPCSYCDFKSACQLRNVSDRH